MKSALTVTYDTNKQVCYRCDLFMNGAMYRVIVFL